MIQKHASLAVSNKERGDALLSFKMSAAKSWRRRLLRCEERRRDLLSDIRVSMRTELSTRPQTTSSERDGGVSESTKGRKMFCEFTLVSHCADERTQTLSSPFSFRSSRLHSDSIEDATFRGLAPRVRSRGFTAFAHDQASVVES